MEINAISTILFGVIVIGVIGYYAIQHLVQRKSIRNEVSIHETIFTIDFDFNYDRCFMFRRESLVQIERKKYTSIIESILIQA